MTSGSVRHPSTSHANLDRSYQQLVNLDRAQASVPAGSDERIVLSRNSRNALSRIMDVKRSVDPSLACLAVVSLDGVAVVFLERFLRRLHQSLNAYPYGGSISTSKLLDAVLLLELELLACIWLIGG